MGRENRSYSARTSILHGYFRTCNAHLFHCRGWHDDLDINMSSRRLILNFKFSRSKLHSLTLPWRSSWRLWFGHQADTHCPLPRAIYRLNLAFDVHILIVFLHITILSASRNFERLRFQHATVPIYFRIPRRCGCAQARFLQHQSETGTCSYTDR